MQQKVGLKAGSGVGRSLGCLRPIRATPWPLRSGWRFRAAQALEMWGEEADHGLPLVLPPLFVLVLVACLGGVEKPHCIGCFRERDSAFVFC